MSAVLPLRLNSAFKIQNSDPHPLTDTETLERVVAAISSQGKNLALVRKQGRVLLALPTDRPAAMRTLELYQPQRMAAKSFVRVLKATIRFGCHRLILSRLTTTLGPDPLDTPFPTIVPGSLGIMLGSPEHKIRRAITSFRNGDQWEVAKVFFGEAGAQALRREAETLEELSAITSAAPSCLGLHHGDDLTILRMPRVTGTPLEKGNSQTALGLLNGWVSSEANRHPESFPEWNAIHKAFVGLPNGRSILDRLAQRSLTPVLRHGDFARWNLLTQPDGTLIALDWEWGGIAGMPGLDLVHFFLQDARLVDRLEPAVAIQKTMTQLTVPACQEYLIRTGWSSDPLLPIIASLAYKQGAGHQENGVIIDAAVAVLSSSASVPLRGR